MFELYHQTITGCYNFSIAGHSAIRYKNGDVYTQLSDELVLIVTNEQGHVVDEKDFSKYVYTNSISNGYDGKSLSWYIYEYGTFIISEGILYFMNPSDNIFKQYKLPAKYRIKDDDVFSIGSYYDVYIFNIKCNDFNRISERLPFKYADKTTYFEWKDVCYINKSNIEGSNEVVLASDYGFIGTYTDENTLTYQGTLLDVRKTGSNERVQVVLDGENKLYILDHNDQLLHQDDNVFDFDISESGVVYNYLHLGVAIFYDINSNNTRSIEPDNAITDFCITDEYIVLFLEGDEIISIPIHQAWNHTHTDGNLYIWMNYGRWDKLVLSDYDWRYGLENFELKANNDYITLWSPKNQETIIISINDLEVVDVIQGYVTLITEDAVYTTLYNHLAKYNFATGHHYPIASGNILKAIYEKDEHLLIKRTDVKRSNLVQYFVMDTESLNIFDEYNEDGAYDLLVMEYKEDYLVQLVYDFNANRILRYHWYSDEEEMPTIEINERVLYIELSQAP